MTGGNWRGATRKRRCLFGLFAFAVYLGLGLGPCRFVEAQVAGPGGVTENLALWLKADGHVFSDKSGYDAGSTPAADGDAVASWADESGQMTRAATSGDAGFAAPIFKDNENDWINFNPVVEFDGTATGLTFYDDYLFSTGTGLSIFASAKSEAGSTGQTNYLLDFGADGGAYGIVHDDTKTQFITPTGHSGTVTTTNHFFGATPIWLKGVATFDSEQNLFVTSPFVPTGNSDSISGLIQITAVEINENSTPDTTVGPLCIGRQAKSFNVDLGDSRRFYGSIGEVIVYASALSDDDQAKVASYLAVKYGNMKEGNFVASDGTVIWDENNPFGCYVAGIGVDDASGLSQTKSRNVGQGSVLIGEQVAPLANGQFLLWGNDCGSLDKDTDVPAGYSQRLERIWMVQETGNPGNVKMCFDLSGLDDLKIDFGNPAGFAILYDDTKDEDFSDARAQTGLTVDGTTVCVNTVDFIDGEHFGLAYPELPHIVIEKTAQDLNGWPLAAGDTIRYRVTLNNTLDQPDTNVTLTDFVPANTSYVDGSASKSWGSHSGPDPFVVDFGDIPANGEVWFQFDVTVDADAVGQTIQNSASADSDMLDEPVATGPVEPPGDHGGLVVAAPGGVGSGLGLWFKAEGISTGVEDGKAPGEMVVQWTNQGFEQLIAEASASASSDIVKVDDAINFNPAVDFSGADAKSLAGEAEYDFGGEPATIFVVFSDEGTDTQVAGLFSAYAGAGAYGPGIVYDAPGFGLDGDGCIEGDTSSPLDRPRLMRAVYATGNNADGGTTWFDGAKEGDGTNCPNSGGTGAYHFEIGGRTAGGDDSSNIGRIFKGKISEVIYYKTSFAQAMVPARVADGNEVSRIESYLALKYGITKAEDYVDSAGNVFWNSTLDVSFSNDIAGIGADPGSALSQRKSRSVNESGIVTGEEVATLSDGQFLVWANDGGSPAKATDVPAGYLQRLERRWMVQETGDPGNVKMCFDLSGLDDLRIDFGNPGGFAILYDDNKDGDYSDARAQSNLSVDGTTVCVDTVDFINGEHFSLAYPVMSSLSIAKTATDVNGPPLEVGDTIHYRVTVNNLADAVNSNVTLTDSVPAYTTYVEGSADKIYGSHSGPDPFVVDFGDVPANAQVWFEFDVTVDANAVGQTIQNFAQADSDTQPSPVDTGPVEPEGDDGGLVVGPVLSLAVEMTAEDVNGSPLREGDVIRYRVTVRNLADAINPNVEASAPIPANTSYVDGSFAKEYGAHTGPPEFDAFTVDFGDLPALGETWFQFDVMVNAGAAGQTIQNTARATSEMQDTPVQTEPAEPPGADGGLVEEPLGPPIPTINQWGLMGLVLFFSLATFLKKRRKQ